MLVAASHCTVMPAVSSVDLACASSATKPLVRYPRIASRTSDNACREISSTSRISFPARCGSRSISLPASSDFNVITDSVCPKHIMQIARNALALGDLGEVLDFFIGLAQLPVHAVALGKEDVARANEDGKDSGPEEFASRSCAAGSLRSPPIAAMAARPAMARPCVSTRKGTMAAAKMKNVQPPALKGRKSDSEKHHAADVHQGARSLEQENSPVKHEEYRGPETIEEPLLAADVIDDGLNEEETEIEDPEQRAPSVIPVLKYGPERPQFERPAPAREKPLRIDANPGTASLWSQPYFQPSGQFRPVLSRGLAGVPDQQRRGNQQSEPFRSAVESGHSQEDEDDGPTHRFFRICAHGCSPVPQGLKPNILRLV